MAPFGQHPSQPLSGTAAQSDPSASLAESLAGLFWQPLPESDDMHEAPRGTGLLQIPGNVFHNFADIGQGLATVGSLAGGRMLETASGQAPFRQTDLDDVLNFTGALIDDYKTGYVDPLVRGDVGAIYNRFATRPVDVASDALMLSPGIKAASKIPAVTHLAESAKAGAMGAGAKLFGHLEQAALKSEEIGPVARMIKEKQLRDSIIGDARRAAAEAYAIDARELDAAGRRIPAPELENLRGIVEGWDPTVFRNGPGMLSEQAQEFLELNKNITRDSQSRLLQMGHVTRDQLVRERWKPVIKKWLKAQYGISDDIDLSKISDAELNTLISEVSEYGASKSIEPSYVPRMTEAAKNKVLSNPHELPEWIVTDHARRARAVAEGASLEHAPKAPWEMERTAFETGENFSADVIGSIKARRLQVLQAHELLTRMMDEVLDAAKDIRNLAPEVASAMQKDPNFTRFKPREFFGSLMDSSEVTTAFDTVQTVSNFFPEEVFIPTPLAKALEKIDRWKVGSLEKLMQGFANFARRYILGFNLLWPEKQFAQNLVMLGLFQWKGPRDALVSFTSYALMKDPKVRAMVPEILKGESFAAETGSPIFGGTLGKAHQLIERGVDFTFQRGQFYDRLSRATAGVYYALKLSERAELSGPIKGMLNSGEALNRLESVFSNPVWLEQVNQKVIKVLGDYSSLAAKERQTIRSMLLWWMWYEHILKYTAALPAEAPFKTALINAIVETHTRMREDAEGMPEGLKQAGAVRLYGMENDQGIPLYTLGGSLNPLGTITELIEFLKQPVEGAESSTVIGALNPVFTLGVALMGINPQTGREFRDPRLVSTGGRQYKYDDLKHGLLKEQHPRPLMAGGLEYAMRTFFPQPTRLAERLFAKVTTGGEPSSFTSVLSGEAAPRLTYDSGGEPLAAGTYQDILKEALLGQRAFPIDEQATIKNEAMDPLRWQKALKAGIRQHGRD